MYMDISIWSSFSNCPFNLFPSFHSCLVVSYDASCMFFLSYLKTLKENLSLVTAERAEGDDEEETLTNVKDSLNDIISLCHQGSQSLNQQQREVLWEREERPNNVVHKSYSLCPPPRPCGFHCWRPWWLHKNKWRDWTVNTHLRVTTQPTHADIWTYTLYIYWYTGLWLV